MLLLPSAARAQLAITEMMPAALKTNGTMIVTNNSDFWELTNYGESAVDLYGYVFSDNKDNRKYPLPASSIGPRESIVFVRNNATQNETQFRAWWGECVPANVQVRFFSNPGLSSGGDGIRIYDHNHIVLDSVDSGPANRGISFVSDTNTGAFGAALSSLGDGYTCQAATASDIGSPGRASDPIPLQIVAQPISVAACQGAHATFSVSAVGLPRPRYQWYFNYWPLPGRTGPTLTVSNVSFSDNGRYWVLVKNGLESVQSLEANLVVNATPSVPSFVTPLADATVVTNRTARFSASVCAYPSPTYQWFSNSVPIPGATGRTLLVLNCTLAMSGTEYSVRAQNSEGSSTSSARLYVTPFPELRITEVQAFPVKGFDGHRDWFEVTNYGSNAVDMTGYRFSDESTLAGSITITQKLIVQPLESVVFAKNPRRSIFMEWWGADLLPPNLQIVLYSGFSLSEAGDTLFLWNAQAETANEHIDGISYATNFSGISRRFDRETVWQGEDSVVGTFGAFRALNGGDIGSPGYIANPSPRFIRITQDSAGAKVSWRAVEGATYQLEYRTSLQGASYFPVGTTTATNALATLIDLGSTNAGAGQRFYRVLNLTP